MVEGQMMAKRIHAERMGFVIDPDTRILVTGGASVNTVILQIIASACRGSNRGDQWRAG